MKTEYQRDLKTRNKAELPRYYFQNNDPEIISANTWRSSAHLLFGNWLNYIYQTTPYNVEKIGEFKDSDPNRPRIRPGNHVG